MERYVLKLKSSILFMRRIEDISVIIPTYNEQRDLPNCLNSLLKQSYKKFRITIVDDGSTDNTREIIKRLGAKDKRINLIEGEHKGPGFSRNLGAKQAKGEILVFVDADMTFNKRYLAELIKPMADRGTIGTIHGYEYATNAEHNPWAKCFGRVRVSYGMKEQTIFRAIRRDKFLEMGGFDPKYGYADDQTFFIKYGIRPILAKGAICYHKNPETLREVYRQSRWIGASLSYQFPVFKIKGLNAISLFGLYILSPAIYPVLTLGRMAKRKDFDLFFYYWPFMFARYFGTLKGLWNFIFLKKNVR